MRADRRPAGHRQATLAYRMARFVLANGNPMETFGAARETLALDPRPVARQVTAGAHGGLWCFGARQRSRRAADRDHRRRDAETISFFGSTAAVDGWRVCIVDTVDEAQSERSQCANKILEEPPQRSLFLLVSHSPAQALPTIMSRCRKLPLRPLAAPT
jgi:DNA polymerase-3 subunit delta'